MVTFWCLINRLKVESENKQTEREARGACVLTDLVLRRAVEGVHYSRVGGPSETYNHRYITNTLSTA